MDDILQEFLAESWENLSRLDTDIVALEREPSNRDLLASIFRTIHTIKGTCGFIGLAGLGSVAHAAENALGQMRDGTLDVTPPAVSIVLAGVDRIKELLHGLEENGKEPEIDSSDLIHKLDLLASLAVPLASAKNKARAAADEFDDWANSPEFGGTEPEPLASAIEVPTTTPQPQPQPQPQPAATASPIIASNPQTAPEPREEPSAASLDGRSGHQELSIRVNVDVLDKLMNLVGELVLTRNQLLQIVRGEDESRYAAPIALLNRVATDLQEGVMKTRMQPIGNAWAKLPRLVRDLAQQTGKQVKLETVGAETELDRTLLDAIKDPLTHMVRNSVDHGIESAQVRRQVGKPECGTIVLQAYHEGGHVIIRIEDDGAGIDRNRVLKKAIEQGLTTEAEGSHLSDAEVLKFIFRAGFSTAEKITSISGRGVGMDVVRTEIERIGGTVELASVAGSGTTVRIKIPLTLAIISGLVVQAGGVDFAIPQLGIVELVRVPAEGRHKIERIRDQRVFRLRNRLLPLLSLSRVLQLGEQEEPADQDLYIVVVQVGEDQLGLVVSDVYDTQEIVVKPVGSLLRDIPVYKGTTILGDGRVIMILDVAGIAAQYGEQAVQSARNAAQTRAEDHDAIEPTSLLIFSGGEGERLAVPLAVVSRLEEFSLGTIERSGDRLLVQYRDRLLPLIPLANSSLREPTRDPQPVVVFSDGEHALGLMVEQIIDILDEPLVIRMQGQRPGVVGTAVVNGRATDIVDAQHYLTNSNPNWFKKSRRTSPSRILAIIESPFFRQLVRTACEADGHRIVAVENAGKAIAMLDQGEQFDAVVCDLDNEDPSLFTLPERLAREATPIPAIAITGLDDLVAGSDPAVAGFTRILAKFQPQQLRATLKELTVSPSLLRGKSA